MSRERDRYIADLEVQIADAEAIKLEREAGGTLTDEQAEEFGHVQSQRKATINVLKAENKQEAIERLPQKFQNGLRTGGQRVKQTGYGVNRWLANIPTPGGVLAAFLVLLFIFMILIQVNGHSRMFWLWLVIIGRAAIPSNESTGNSKTENGPTNGASVTTSTNTNFSGTTLQSLPSFQPITSTGPGIGNGVLNFPSSSTGFMDTFYSAMGEFA